MAPRQDEDPVVRTGRRRGLWVVLPLLVIGLGLGLVFLPRSRLDEASAEMAVSPAPIDGARAYKYLKEICAVGPRTAGSAANARQRALIGKHFEKLGATVVEQPFTGTDPKTQAKVEMANLIASWNPERKERVVIGAHYDTRPHPDEDKDPAKRAGAFVGANDPASGMALLMEIAHHLDAMTTPWGVDLVLFDGEELVYGTGNDQDGEYFLGSKEFARRYSDGMDDKTVKYRYAAGIVLDLIGGKGLHIDVEPHSRDFAPGLVKEVWAVARRIKATAFRDREGRAVNDDHLQLNNAGIPAIDLIDFNYPYWHTSEDLPDKCSGTSLEQVGKVVTGWLSQPRRRK